MEIFSSFEPFLLYPTIKHEYIESLKDIEALSLIGGVRDLGFYFGSLGKDHFDTINEMVKSKPNYKFWTPPLVESEDGSFRLGFFSKAKELGAIGVSAGMSCIESVSKMRQIMEYAASMGLIVHSFPFNEGDYRGSVIYEGELATRLGLPSCPKYQEFFTVYRDIELSKITDCEVIIGPISLKESVDLIRLAKNQNCKVKAFTAVPFLLFTEKDLSEYSSLYKTLPHLGNSEDQKHLLDALNDGTLDFLCSGHSAALALGKDRELEGAQPGISMLSFSVFAQKQISTNFSIDLKTVNNWCSSNVFKALNLENPKNKIKIDFEESFHMNQLFSGFSSCNNPFWDQELKGKSLGVA